MVVAGGICVRSRYRIFKRLQIKLTFDNGENRIADCWKWLNGEVFEPLKDIQYFQKFFVDGWSMSWSNGPDIAPETLYEEGEIF